MYKKHPSNYQRNLTKSYCIVLPGNQPRAGLAAIFLLLRNNKSVTVNGGLTCTGAPKRVGGDCGTAEDMGDEAKR